MCRFCEGNEVLETTIGDYGLTLHLDEETQCILNVRIVDGNIGISKPIVINNCLYCGKKLRQRNKTMFTEGDIFKINGIKYKLRFINKNLMCFLEPVLYLNDTQCITGGLNEVYSMNELLELENLELIY